MLKQDLRPLRILHLEDDPSYSRLVRDSLARSSTLAHELVLAPSLREAVQRLERERFDAALAELTLSDGSGLDVCRTFARWAEQSPLVVLTNREDDELALAAMDAGAQDVLVKGKTDGRIVLRSLQFARERIGLGPAAAASFATSGAGTLRILAVEEQAGDAVHLREALAAMDGPAVELTCVGRLDEALERLQDESFGIVILDLSLPDGRGVDSCIALCKRTPRVPFIVYSGSNDERLALQTIQRGAADYLVKGHTDPRALTRSIRFALRRHRPGSAQDSQERSSSNIRPGDGDPIRGDFAHLGPWQSAPNSERRANTRYALVRSVLAVPVGADCRPDWEHRLPGATFDLSAGGMGLELETDRPPTGRALIVGVEGRDGELWYAGVQICHADMAGPRRLRVGGKFGGLGEKVLSPASLTPTIDVPSMQIVRGLSDDVLNAWSEIGVLRPVLLDWIDVCSKCRGLPTVRAGCRSCGSGRISSVRMIHHFACAHVAPVSDFERDGELICPKCRVRRLVVGADFEFQAGLFRCLDCHWSAGDLEQVCQCLRCGRRFPSRQALSLEMIGYHVHRLDPLALISTP